MLSLLAPAAAASLLLMAILIWKRLTFSGHGELAVSMVFGALFFLFRADAADFAWLSPVLCLGPLACNRAVRAAFETEERPWWLEGVLVLAVSAGGYGYAGHVIWAQRIFEVASLWLFLELPVVAWRALADDLIAARRQVRLWCLAIGAGLSTAIALVSLAGQVALATDLGAAAVIVLACSAMAFGDHVVKPEAATAAKALDSRDTQVLARLRALMQDEVLYRDPNLTLSRLAQRLDVPEHRLRRVIHIGEGQRNFSTWLNDWRIAEIKGVLDDPAREETLLSLAVAAGYNSLSAFNRAFKAVEGVTPSAYRAARTAKTMANVKKTAEAASDTTTP